jgi:hypothetical protein
MVTSMIVSVPSVGNHSVKRLSDGISRLVETSENVLIKSGAA